MSGSSSTTTQDRDQQQHKTGASGSASYQGTGPARGEVSWKSNRSSSGGDGQFGEWFGASQKSIMPSIPEAMQNTMQHNIATLASLMSVPLIPFQAVVNLTRLAATASLLFYSTDNLAAWYMAQARDAADRICPPLPNGQHGGQQHGGSFSASAHSQ